LTIMNTLSAIDLKRRGLVAIEEKLALGPVHILMHNRPAAVIIRESEYQTLIQKKITPKNQSAVHWIVDYKPGGTRSKQDIDQQIREERSSWVGE